MGELTGQPGWEDLDRGLLFFRPPPPLSTSITSFTILAGMARTVRREVADPLDLGLVCPTDYAYRGWPLL